MNKYAIRKKCLKYFIGYVGYFDDNIKSVHINSPKSNGSVKMFIKVKYISFILEEKHGDILKKFNGIWNRVKDIFGKDFDIKVIHAHKYITHK